MKRSQEESNEMVQVMLRCRPMNEKEKTLGCVNVVKVHPTRGVIEIYDPKVEKMDRCKVFNFDAAYDWNCSQQEIYDQMVRPLVEAVLSGFNSTVFAYGQSGTGKTYTMEGKITEDNAKGITPKVFEHIFQHISNSQNMQYLVRTSYLEIYQDEIRDLLGTNQNKKFELRENKELGVYVKNLKSFACKSEKEMKTVLISGSQKRTVGFTDMNERSSRSHAIFSIIVEMKDIEGPSKDRVRVGKLNLVDLAGSERQNKTNAQGKRLKEASKINLSLTALSKVISALVDNKEHYIPYRDSKLTRLLRDSLGGNSKTLMIANIGPASYNYDESVNTLRYATRTRNIKNEPRVNEDPKDTLLRKYQDEITKLKCQLADKTSAQIKLLKNQKIEKPIKNENITTPSYLINEPHLSKAEDTSDKYGFTGEKKEYGSINYEFESQEYINMLKKRIESMESKLIIGSFSILEHTSEQKKILEAHHNEIVESEQREREIQEMLDLQVEVAEEIREDYSNLEQEVDMKLNKLKKLFYKLQNVRQEITDAQEEYNIDRRELEMTAQYLLRDIKLRHLIVENFIPSKDRRRILSRFVFDEDLDSWKVMPDYEPTEALPKLKCSVSMRRPATLHTLFTQKKTNHLFRCNPTNENRLRTFRFKEENLLDFELVEELLTTKDFKRSRIPSALNSIFHIALQEEGDIYIDASQPSLNVHPSLRTRGDLQSGTCNGLTKALQSISFKASSVYPKARGLVPK